MGLGAGLAGFVLKTGIFCWVLLLGGSGIIIDGRGDGTQRGRIA